MQSPTGVNVSYQRGALRFRIPPGPKGRPSAVVRPRARIGGNFELRATYRLDSFPRPKSEWLNFEIFVDSENGAATVIRTSNADVGQGVSAWAQLSDPEADGLWAFQETEAKQGELMLRRTGSELTFWASTEPDGELVKLSQLEYGVAPIHLTEFRIQVPATSTLIDVSIDKVSITADNIIEELQARKASGPTTIGSRLPWFVVALLALLGAWSLVQRFGKA